MVTNKENIKLKFQDNLIPDGNDFNEVFDSYINKIDDKATLEMVQEGTNNECYVTPALLKTGLQDLAIITGNCYIPNKEHFDNFSGESIELEYLPISHSVRVFKNGQLLLEGTSNDTNPDYTLDYESGEILFSLPVVNRNIEIDYWYKNLANSQEGAIDLTSLKDINAVHLTGNETITGNKTFNKTGTADQAILTLNNSSTGEGFRINNSNNGKGIVSNNTSEGIGIYSDSTGTGDGIVSTIKPSGLGYAFVGQDDNTNTFTVDKFGNIIANKFTVTGGTDQQILLADGSIKPVSDFSLATGIVNWGNVINNPTSVAGYGIIDVYTKTEVNNFFGGTTVISGYNKSNWDTAYGWGNHANVGYLLSATYTATDVLNKIKTVDGVSSGLDSDLLDGQQGTYYLDYNNFTNKPNLANYITGTGTRTASRIPKFNSNTVVTNSNLYDDGSLAGLTTTAGAAYFILKGIDDGDNFGALELSNSNNTNRWQFGHKNNGDFAFNHYSGGWSFPFTIKNNGNTLVKTTSDNGRSLQVGGDITSKGIFVGQSLNYYIYNNPDNIVSFQNQNDVFSIAQIQSPYWADVSTGDREATLALMREYDNGAEFLDFYNNGYSDGRQYGIRIQKRGSGNYHPFVFEFASSLADVNEVYRITPNKNILIGTKIDDNSNSLQINGYTKATGYRIPSGESSWFLKADGSYDTNGYAKIAVLNNYLPLVGGTLTDLLNVTGANKPNYNGVGNLDVSTTNFHASDLGGMISLGGNYNGTNSKTTFVNIAGRKENGIANDKSGYFELSVNSQSEGGMIRRIAVQSDGSTHVDGTVSAYPATQDDHLVTLAQLNAVGVSSGIYTPTSGGISFSSCFWHKVGNIATVYISGTVYNVATMSAFYIDLPSGLTINSPSTGKVMGIGLASNTASNYQTSGEVIIKQRSVNNSFEFTLDSNATANYTFSMTFTFIAN